jgi:hypothetical protein
MTADAVDGEDDGLGNGGAQQDDGFRDDGLNMIDGTRGWRGD